VRPDAIVIGAGPNGLVAANVLADAGWEVLVLEAEHEPGGAVRTSTALHPNFRHDLFSAFYPMTAASPVIAELHLDEDGLRWTHAPSVLAHPRPDRPAVVLSRDLDITIRSVDAAHPGDGNRYRRLYEQWTRVGGPLMASLLRPFPPVRPAWRLLRAAGVDGTLDLARLALLPVRRMVEEVFDGEAAGLLFAGNALHADLTPDSAGSGLFGWMLTSLGQQLGFPVPVGGAGEITAALARRARRRGVRIECGRPVARIDVASGCARGVVTEDGERVAARTVVADCDATTLLVEMVGADHLPSRALRRIGRFQRAGGTFKVDWALATPVPWSDPAVNGAGTVHVADGLDELTVTAAQLAMGQVPREPFLLVGQMTTADATRSPAGTESMWAYTHVPQRVVGDAGPDGICGRWDDTERDAFAGPDGSAHRAVGAGLLVSGPGSIGVVAPGYGAARSQPGRGRHQRRDGTSPSATGVPSDDRCRASGDPDRRSVPRVGLGPPRRRRPRCVRRQRGARRTGPFSPAPPARTRSSGTTVRPRRIDGSRVVVVGATSGVGRAVALSLAARGARLLVVARDSDDVDELAGAARGLGSEAWPLSADIGIAADVARITSAALAHLGGIDTWINAAAGLVVGELADQPVADIQRLIMTNVLGTTLASRAAMAHFDEVGVGVLVNVSSLLGVIPNPIVPTYVMSKFAVRGLTLSLHQSVIGRRGRHVCVVLPGPIDTPMFARAANHSGRPLRAIPPAFSPERVAATVIRSANGPGGNAPRGPPAL